MINVVDFTIDHVGEAEQIAMQNYEAQRRNVPALPPVEAVPDLTSFAENGLGAAAFEGGKMLGFLCAVGPFEHTFRSTDAIGVFSPVHANGTVKENRAKIYARLYQAAGEKWARAGASSHAVCLYAGDCEGQRQFFQYGFGLRCVDAMRWLEEIEAPPCPGFTILELPPEEHLRILPLDHMLDAHMAGSPTFMLRASRTEESFMDEIMREKPRYFAAKKDGKIAAYIKMGGEAETFLRDTPHMANICGAFCLPEYRGQGVYQNLLNALIRTIKGEGYTRLSVDFESINPTANGFWLKYFSAYTHSVVRRIDEHVLTRR